MDVEMVLRTVADLDLSRQIALVLGLPALAWLWRFAVICRVTSTGYTYRSKGRWGETEIRPPDQK